MSSCYNSNERPNILTAGPNNCCSCLFEDGREAPCSSVQQSLILWELLIYAWLNVCYLSVFVAILISRKNQSHILSNPFVFSLLPQDKKASKDFICYINYGFRLETNRGDRSYKPNPRLARVLDILFILHAEHEMNCSTAAARHLASRLDIIILLKMENCILYILKLHKSAFAVVLMYIQPLLEQLEPCMVLFMEGRMR